MFAHYTPTVLVLIFTMVIEGLRKRFPNAADKLTINGVSMLVTDIISTLQGYLSRFQAPEDAHRVVTEAVEKREEVKPAALQFLRYLESALKPILGEKSQALKDFGFTPPKERPALTGKQIVDRTVKAKATREARHTVGKKVKKGIKGNPPPSNGKQ